MQDMEKTVAVTQPDSVSDDAVQDQATDETQSELEQFLSDGDNVRYIGGSVLLSRHERR